MTYIPITRILFTKLFLFCKSSISAQWGRYTHITFSLVHVYNDEEMTSERGQQYNNKNGDGIKFSYYSKYLL